MSLDISKYMEVDSNRLNADDLISSPIVVQIMDVKVGSDVKITISGGHKPFLPCKTCLRILAGAHKTKNAAKWIGTWMRLYRDDSVRWAGEEVGGVRIDALSCVEETMTLTLNESNKRKTQWKIQPLKPPATDAPTRADHLARIRHLLTQIEDPSYEQKLIETFGAIENMNDSNAAKCVERLESLVGEEKERGGTQPVGEASGGMPQGAAASEPVRAAIERKVVTYAGQHQAAVREALHAWYSDSGVSAEEALKMIPRAKCNPTSGTVSF